MSATAFTRFDPHAFLRAAPAKAATAAKAERERGPALATLATLARAPSELHISEPAADAWTDVQEERAAIIEHDGKAPRAWAEALARLDPAKPPADISPQRWQRFVDDCGHFIDRRWAARAMEFGWGPLNLFGCDRISPFGRLDHAGLIWLLNGGTIVELHRDRAVIQTRTGARQSYRRGPVDIDRVVLAWELAP